jgi:hypothetical protein
MPKTLDKPLVKSNLTQGILSTLAFFAIYNLPITERRLWELLYRVQATPEQVRPELIRLVQLGVIVHRNGLYALDDWDDKQLIEKQAEIDKRWTRIRKYYWLLSAIPYVEHISVINSVAMGNADSESDIDFFIVTKPNRLYFVRSVIIILFKMLGVYKDKTHINMRFCFGFYVTSDHLSIKELLLHPEDPYLVFWLGTIIPVYSLKYYERLMKENKWINSWLPNFRTMQRLDMYRKLKPNMGLKKFLEALSFMPAMILEPVLRRIHIRHTFNLPENNWQSSSTIANRTMLKLHALDPRKDLRDKFWATLRNY